MKKMTKWIALLVAMLTLCAVFTACGKDADTKTSDDQGASAAQNAYEKVIAAGKLTVATSPDFPPFESIADNGEYVGIEMDLIKKIGEKLGVSVEIVQMDFDTVLAGVQAGKFDCAASGITVDEDRQKNMDFTDAYCLAAQAIIVKEDSPIKTKADLDGKTVSVQSGTTADKFCQQNGYTVSAFSANNDAQAALVAGKVDAWVIDDLSGAEMVKAYNESHDDKLVVLSEAMTTEPYAFAFSKGSDALVEKVNAALKELEADGTVAALFEKYDAPFTAPDAE